MKGLISKKETFIVKDGSEFDKEIDAIEYCKNYIFVYDEYDECFVALCMEDINRYKRMLRDDQEAFEELYKDLCNSNSMGSLYPLRHMSHAYLLQNGNDISELWGEDSFDDD